ncbi:hypothetical protein HMPREF9099_02860 [Lachnospiraceae bacterium oral taxon 082 str. F0431]|nr:hypothetical protein HMPREF9099_02860 [Lachnospiraceae bacterium oral taxon 082 str. F0431]
MSSIRPYPISASYVYSLNKQLIMNLDSLITTCKPYLGEVCPFLGVLSLL